MNYLWRLIYYLRRDKKLRILHLRRFHREYLENGVVRTVDGDKKTIR